LEKTTYDKVLELLRKGPETRYSIERKLHVSLDAKILKTLENKGLAKSEKVDSAGEQGCNRYGYKIVYRTVL